MVQLSSTLFTCPKSTQPVQHSLFLDLPFIRYLKMSLEVFKNSVTLTNQNPNLKSIHYLSRNKMKTVAQSFLQPFGAE